MSVTKTCAQRLDSAWNASAGLLTIAYTDKAIFSLNLDEAEGTWQRQQTKFPVEIEKLRVLQTSALPFQLSGLVAAVGKEDAGGVWVGSLLFPDVEKIKFSESVVDVAWLKVSTDRFRLYVLTRSALFTLNCLEKNGKPQVDKNPVLVHTFSAGVGVHSWDRVFPVANDEFYLASETGNLGTVDAGGVRSEKFADWVHEMRMGRVNDSIYLCGVFTKDKIKSLDGCFRYDSSRGQWQPSETPTSLLRPLPPVGFFENLIEPSYPLRVLMGRGGS